MQKTIQADIEMKKRGPTSLNIDEDLWTEVRIASLRLQITATEFVEQALKEKLEKISKK